MVSKVAAGTLTAVPLTSPLAAIVTVISRTLIREKNSWNKRVKTENLMSRRVERRGARGEISPLKKKSCIEVRIRIPPDPPRSRCMHL